MGKWGRPLLCQETGSRTSRDETMGGPIAPRDIGISGSFALRFLEIQTISIAQHSDTVEL